MHSLFPNWISVHYSSHLWICSTAFVKVLSVWTLLWIWQEVYAKKSIQSLAYGGNSSQCLSSTAVRRDCTVSRPYWCASIINISAVKGNLFVNTMPASCYHFIHPMQCTRTDLQFMLDTHELTWIYISSGTVSDVIVSGILSKQVCNFFLVPYIKPRHNVLSQS